MPKKEIYTIGTSNRYIEEFIDILKHYRIKSAIDVRSYPKSKRFVHFNRVALSEMLNHIGIEYIYLGRELGGFRQKGYLNHMNTEEFKRGIKAIEDFALKKSTIFFCCEKLFFKCHRRFISDELVKRGWKVIHIVDKDKVYEHESKQINQEELYFGS